MLRRRWILAVAISLAIHAGVVMALTRSDAADEAGSGAGSRVIGSVDATIGVDMPVETLTEPMAAETPRPDDTPEVEAASGQEAEPVAVAALPTAASDALAPVETREPPPSPPAVEIAAADATALAAPAAAAAPVEIAASTPLEAIEAPAIEADLAAAPTLASTSDPLPAATSAVTEATSIAAAASDLAPADAPSIEPVLPVSSPALDAAESGEETEPNRSAALAAAPAAETIDAVAPEPAIDAAAAPLPQPKPETAPPRRVAKAPPKASQIARKAEKTAARRAPDTTNSRRGGEIADAGSPANDPGAGRSQEAGRGAALKANYVGRVVAALRRARRYPDGTSARGIAQVAFQIRGDGGVSGLRLIASSGDPDIDQAALGAVLRAAPFPPPPRPPFSIRVPIEFRRR